MIHEKILVREDKSRVKIEVRLYCNSLREDFSYIVSLYACEPRKRTFYHLSNVAGFVTPEEIHQAKLELWEKLKPVEEN